MATALPPSRAFQAQDTDDPFWNGAEGVGEENLEAFLNQLLDTPLVALDTSLVPPVLASSFGLASTDSNTTHIPRATAAALGMRGGASALPQPQHRAAPHPGLVPLPAGPMAAQHTQHAQHTRRGGSAAGPGGPPPPASQLPGPGAAGQAGVKQEGQLQQQPSGAGMPASMSGMLTQQAAALAAATAGGPGGGASDQPFSSDPQQAGGGGSGGVMPHLRYDFAQAQEDQAAMVASYQHQQAQAAAAAMYAQQQAAYQQQLQQQQQAYQQQAAAQYGQQGVGGPAIGDGGSGGGGTPAPAPSTAGPGPGATAAAATDPSAFFQRQGSLPQQQAAFNPYAPYNNPYAGWPGMGYGAGYGAGAGAGQFSAQSFGGAQSGWPPYGYGYPPYGGQMQFPGMQFPPQQQSGAGAGAMGGGGLGGAAAMGSMHLPPLPLPVPAGAGAMSPQQEVVQQSEGPGGGHDDDPCALKKPRLIWTAALHRRFLESVERVGGVDRALPKAVMQEMGVAGLTRENVASHLQKHRMRLKKEEEAGGGGGHAGDHAPACSGDAAMDDADHAAEEGDLAGTHAHANHKRHGGGEGGGGGGGEARRPQRQRRAAAAAAAAAPSEVSDGRTAEGGA